METLPLFVIIYALDIFFIVTIIGVVVVRLWILPEELIRQEIFAKNLPRLLTINFAFISVSGLLILLLRTMNISEVSFTESFSLLPSVLISTHTGSVFLVRIAATIGLWMGWLKQRSHLYAKSIYIYYAICIAVIAFTCSATSHAADQGDFTLAEIMDWLHILSTSMWAGSIVVMTLIVLPKVIHSWNLYSHNFLRIIYRFSSLAFFAVAIVVMTGIYSTWRHGMSIAKLFATHYGNVLSMKLIFVSMMLLLGGLNKFILKQRLKKFLEQRVAMELKRSVFLEALLVPVVVILAAILTQTVPPNVSGIMQ